MAGNYVSPERSLGLSFFRRHAAVSMEMGILFFWTLLSIFPQHYKAESTVHLPFFYSASFDALFKALCNTFPGEEALTDERKRDLWPPSINFAQKPCDEATMTI